MTSFAERHAPPIEEAAGSPHAPCAPYAVEVVANRAALQAYLRALDASLAQGLVNRVWFSQRDTGLATFVTEVRAGGDADALRPLYDAELAAHDAAIEAGGTAPFEFEIVDLDIEPPRLYPGFEAVR
ncbi:MAG: hypothetical protein IT303_17200 [Dehalococcoidia bacterium]|nr:hypothetical protein [Dehalococcoidia bacterium]